MSAPTTSNSSYIFSERFRYSRGSISSQISSLSAETQLRIDGISSMGSLSPIPEQSPRIRDSPSHTHGSQTSLNIDKQSVGATGNEDVQPRGSRTGIFSSWWWWWEIGGSIVSLIGLGLIIFVLKLVDDQPIDSWSYLVRPNSLISGITTVTKASMMIPIASCLGQLKWNHFQHRPNSLYHLQIYDDASRGPWGCFYMISTGHLRAISAWVLALLTLAALGFEPSIQQTIEPLTRQTLLRNVTAQIGKASSYNSKSFANNGYTDLIRLQAAIFNGVAGSVQEPNFSCPEPAVKCIWDRFDTLAICVDFTNATNTVTMECDTLDIEQCAFTFPEGDTVNIFDFPTLYSSSISVNLPLGPNILYGIRLHNVPEHTVDPELIEWEAFTISFNWCTRTYHTVAATPAGIQTCNYTSTPLFSSNLSVTHAENPSPLKEEDSLLYYYLHSNSSKQSLKVSLYGLLLLSYPILLLEHESTDYDISLGGSDTRPFIYHADLRKFTSNLEETLTNQIRSSLPGDNQDSEMWPGRAFYQETYWCVHWPWVIIPIAEVVITIILLGTTIMFSQNQLLFKSSPLALLVHPLARYRDNRVLHGIQDNSVGVGKLEDFAKGMRVELREDEEGILKFLPVEDESAANELPNVLRNNTEPGPQAQRVVLRGP